MRFRFVPWGSAVDEKEVVAAGARGGGGGAPPINARSAAMEPASCSNAVLVDSAESIIFNLIFYISRLI